MCHRTGIESLRESESVIVDHSQQLQSRQQEEERFYLMMDNSPAMTPGSAASSNEENPRVKFLCSFSGSILPRPQDGRLRYVGGETRIVSVPRDISYDDLMGRMRELFEGVTVLKYQQPDEDLDALVSVVNDDDVTNMMEEYDKLGSGDGFTRLRVFLFSHADQDVSAHFVDGDERDNERRYVDALNSLNESPEFRKHQPSESVVMGLVDDAHLADQYFNQMSLDAGLHGSQQRNTDMHMPQMNLRHLTIPHLVSGQPQQSVNQRYSEMEAPWSPAYYSPRQPVNHDQRAVGEFPASPSSSRYRTPYGDFPDRSFERMPEEYNRSQVSHQAMYEPQPQYADNVMMYPSGAAPGDKAGFPGNILQGTNVLEGNSICEQCRSAFQRNQAYPDTTWRAGEQPHMEPPSIVNGFQPSANPCADCPPSRDLLMMNADANLHHPYYNRDLNDSRSLYTEQHQHERGWVLQHQQNLRAEEPRHHVSVAGRLADHYIIDNGVSISLGHGSIADSHHPSPHYVQPEDPRCVRPGPDLNSHVLQDQAFPTGLQLHAPPADERGIQYAGPSYAYGADNVYQVTHGHVPPQIIRRNVHVPLHGGPPYEASVLPPLANGSISPGFLRTTLESSPRLQAGLESQNSWVEQSQKILGLNGPSVPEYSHSHSLKLTSNSYGQENQSLYPVEPVGSSDMLKNAFPVESSVMSNGASAVNGKVVSLITPLSESRKDNNITESAGEEKTLIGLRRATGCEGEAEDCNVHGTINAEQKTAANDVVYPETLNPGSVEHALKSSVEAEQVDKDICSPENEELPDDSLSFLPELIASVKKAALESVKEVKAKAQEASLSEHEATEKEDAQNEGDAVVSHENAEIDSENDNVNNSKIEPTKAEAEAIDRGLQTIRNEDLEEIRELGSGTYGSVYHGKWKGSDVAIKRIKASCFAGRPSERERLIADFWKEALILSSLHHPNVVSFYGVVRDGPDGSLATVTEFMVNGSLKQFLQKKDRTIDRRKRLIIAMDTAFGMEYLHGKNIVHFDLKCENLLVNMRDPHRPVCKIGDLGLSKVKQHTLVSGGVRGTLPWMAPELLSGKSNMVTEKIDVYSFGIVMWELLTGDEPYANMHCASIIGGIVNNTLRPQIPTWCDPEWKSLMESCWASDPAERPSFSDISQKLRNMAAAMNLK